MSGSRALRVITIAASAVLAITAVSGVAAAKTYNPGVSHHRAGRRQERPDAALVLAHAARSVRAARPGARAYTVQGGDTLSGIARKYLGAPRRWEGLYAANRAAVGRYPSQMAKGTVLRLVNKGLTANFARHIRNVTRPRPVHVTPVASAPASAAPAAAPAAPVASAPAQSSYSGAYPGGSFGACVVARESGGNSQVMNSTGHYGLYQFSASTWAAYGGNPADFGNASVSEQNQVFANAMAQGGESNWAPYDGC